MRHYNGLSISILQKVREPNRFSNYNSMIIKSNTNKEINTTMLIHSQEGLVPKIYDRLDQKEEHLRREEAGLYVCYAMCIDTCNLDDSECSGRSMEQAGIEGVSGAGQRCAADSAFEGEK